jgi:hypothetical protein
MTATTKQRLPTTKGPVPTHGTYPVAANTHIKSGWLCALNATGYLVPSSDGDGFNAIGISRGEFDNRTTAPEGGGAGAILGDVDFGTFTMLTTGTAPVVSEIVFAVDNQTVSTDSDSGARGLAGLVVQMDDTICHVFMSPVLTPTLDASAVSTLAARVTSLEVDAASVQAFVSVPITSFTDSGAPLLAWVDGSVNGLELTDSEALAFRFGPVGEDTSVLAATVPLPPDLDATGDIVVHALVARIGALDTTAVVTGAAFFHTVGAAHTADADAIAADSAAIAGATTIVQELTWTIDAADVPAAPCDVTITLAPDAALDADDLIVTSVWLEYTRAQRTS